MFLYCGSTDMILMFFSFNMKTLKRYVHLNYVYSQFLFKNKNNNYEKTIFSKLNKLTTVDII